LKNIKVLRSIFLLLLLLPWIYSEERPKIGLVLGGGGAKGLAHIPVLNEKLPFSFISRLFSLKQGDPVDGTRISQQIMGLYALGYFENIGYDVYPAGNNKVDIFLNVKELPRGKLRGRPAVS